MSGKKSQDLVIPIYLDTNTLMDILASIEGGFSIAEKITSSSTESKSSQQSGSGEFGVAAVFSMFKVNFKGSASRAKDQKADEEHTTERFHTYGSLLNKLRTILSEEQLLKQVGSEELWKSIDPSDFVEVRGKFIPNPLRDSMQTLVGIIDYMMLLGGLPGVQLFKDRNEAENFKKIRKVIEGMQKDFEHESNQIYIVQPTPLDNHKIVVKLFPQYIRDRSGRELPYGEFTMLGKVIRKTAVGGTINLLQGSVLSALGNDFTSKFFDAFKGMDSYGIKIPQMNTKVDGPAMQIIPIAIYV